MEIYKVTKQNVDAAMAHPASDFAEQEWSDALGFAYSGVLAYPPYNPVKLNYGEYGNIYKIALLDGGARALCFHLDCCGARAVVVINPATGTYRIGGGVSSNAVARIHGRLDVYDARAIKKNFEELGYSPAGKDKYGKRR